MRQAVADCDVMTHILSTEAFDPFPTYLARGDPAGRFVNYYPAWVDNLAVEVTLEGSMLDGAVQGADAVHALISGARSLYDRQDFSFAGEKVLGVRSASEPLPQQAGEEHHRAQRSVVGCDVLCPPVGVECDQVDRS